MSNHRPTIIILLCILCASCSVIRRGDSHLDEGIYHTRFPSEVEDRVFIAVDAEQQYNIYPLHGPGVDTNHVLHYPAASDRPDTGVTLFYRHSFDVDVLTTLFKFRPKAAGFPRQLNTNFNGAAYFGMRTDAYRVSYGPYPLRGQSRRVTHLGLSAGAFIGPGAATMNPWVTEPAINDEYDGFVISGGGAVIIALNNLTAGVGVGVDHLTDPNRHAWIYQHKPWVGIVFGLNLN